jgi:hypothetical protein
MFGDELISGLHAISEFPFHTAAAVSRTVRAILSEKGVKILTLPVAIQVGWRLAERTPVRHLPLASGTQH